MIGLVIASCSLLAIDPSPNTIPLPPVEVDSFRASYVPEPVRVVVVERQIALRSCFGAGTPVLTRSGLQPIERVEVGDLVLSQDTVTGALSYRPVVAALHNPPAATLRVILGGGESITATGIHRFWRPGYGWVMARHLTPGDRVRTMGGIAEVVEVVADPVQPVYNLEVAATANFFVGHTMALVHDNTLVGPTPEPFDAASTHSGVSQPAE